MCKGGNCPLKDLCYRYTAKADEYQSYFIKEPYTLEKNKFKCNMLWTNDNQSILDQLRSILNKEGDK